ncbi:MAG: S-layer homology domain-containing protein [Clostridiales bacterium]|nr:S-layer homology domain-containing protein [Clostridiales bacterium]
MKIKSKFLSSIIIMTIILSLSGQVMASAKPFSDLGSNAAGDKIVSLYEKGFVKGTGNGMFSPDAAITTAQEIQLLVNVLGLNLDTIRFIKEPKATDYFKNADNEAWYSNAFIIASVNGLGFPGSILPDSQMTREEFTYYLVTSFEAHYNLPKIKLSPAAIKDQDQITADYDGALQRSLVYGIVSLDSEGRYNPKALLTRAEAAEEVYNAITYAESHKVE